VGTGSGKVMRKVRVVELDLPAQEPMLIQ